VLFHQLRRLHYERSLSDCLDDDALIATHFDGKPLPREHGGPARVIIPKLYAWKGAKVRPANRVCGRRQTGVFGKCAVTATPPILDGRSLFVSAPPRAPRRLTIVAAFAALYLIWGSTYLGILFAIKSIPPLLMAGTASFSPDLIMLRESRAGRVRGNPLLPNGAPPFSWALVCSSSATAGSPSPSNGFRPGWLLFWSRRFQFTW
jgi:hypothetical protein